MAEKAKETEQMVQSLQQEKADAEERPAFLKDFLVYVMAGRNVCCFISVLIQHVQREIRCISQHLILQTEL